MKSQNANQTSSSESALITMIELMARSMRAQAEAAQDDRATHYFYLNRAEALDEVLYKYRLGMHIDAAYMDKLTVKVADLELSA